MSIKAHSPADVIASVSHLLGFTPTNSLVVVTLHGKVTGATLRMDLPDPDADPMDFIRVLIGHISADTKADASLVMLYTDEPAKDGDPWPYAQLMDWLDSALEGDGKPVKDWWLVTPTSWRTYGCSDECCQEHPISSVTDSIVNATLTVMGSDPTASTTATDTSFAGTHWDSELVDLTAAGFDFESYDFEGMDPWRLMWDSCSEEGYSPDKDEMLTLLATLQYAPLRDRIYADSIDPSDDLDRYADTFLGRPRGEVDWARLDRREALLKSLLPYAEGVRRVPVFALLALMEWVKGHATMSNRYIRLALALNPEHTLSNLLRRLINSGGVAPICRDEARAYRAS